MAARVGKPTGTITWSDGSLFNGFAVVGIVLPTTGGSAYPEIQLEGNTSRFEIPIWATIPIKDGAFHSQSGLWYNADINPPNTKYAIYYYDSAWVQIAGPASSSDFFLVASESFTPTTYTLNVPTLSTTIPVPVDASGELDYPSHPYALTYTPGGSNPVPDIPSADTLIWDSVNKRLGIGRTPEVSLHVKESIIVENPTGTAVVYLYDGVGASNHKRWRIRTNSAAGGSPFTQLFLEALNDANTDGKIGIKFTWDSTNPSGFINDAQFEVPVYFNASFIRFGDRASTGPGIYTGSGSPEGAVTAVVGSLFTRTDGGTGTTLYVKESGSGNTGWVAK